MRIGILNMGIGNIKAIKNAINYIGIKKIKDIKNIKNIKNIKKIIIPGHGNILSTKKKIKTIETISKLKEYKKIRILGICLGMQMMHSFNKEGNMNGMNILKNTVKKIKETKQYKVPNIGWRKVKPTKKNKIIKKENNYYFSHSYFLENSKNTIATTFYKREICAIFKKKNYLGVQFHPEKSGKQGIKIIKRFLKK